jgi:hypothetical protein
MGISDFSRWFWPALSFVLAGLWLWTLLRQRRTAHMPEPSASGPCSLPGEVEDVLKAAYALQEESGAWQAAELAQATDLSEPRAKEVTAELVASRWVEETDQDGMYHLTEAGKGRAQELIRAHRGRKLVASSGQSWAFWCP